MTGLKTKLHFKIDRRILLLGFLVGYLCIGLFLRLFYDSSRNNHSVKNGYVSAETIGLPDTGLSQRVIGEDYPLRGVIFLVADSSNMAQEESLRLDLYERSDNAEQGTLLNSRIITAAQIAERNAIVAKYDSVPFVYNRDYYFVLSWENHMQGELFLKLSMNDGKDLFYTGSNGALPYPLYCEITYGRGIAAYTGLWRLLLVLLVLPFGVCCLTKTTFWKGALFTFLGLGFSLYLMGAFAMLSIAHYVVIGVGVAALAYICLGYAFYPEKMVKVDRDMLLQVLVWMAALVFAYIQIKNVPIYYQDEYNHWALAVENLYTFRKMYFHDYSTVHLLRYPPFTTFVEYFFEILMGHYSTAAMRFAKMVLQISGILYFVDFACKKRRSGFYYLYALVMALILPEVWIEDGFNNTINTDIIAGIYTGIIMCEGYAYLKEPQTKRGWGLLIVSFITILAKDNSMILIAACYGGLLLVAFGNVLFHQGKVKEIFAALGWSLAGFVLGRGHWAIWVQLVSKGMKEQTFRLVTLGVILILAVLVWGLGKVTQRKLLKQVVCWTIASVVMVGGVAALIALGKVDMNATDVSAYAQSGINPTSIVSFLKGNGPEYRYTILKTHPVKLLFENMYDLGVVSVPFAGAIGVLLTWIAYLYSRVEGRKKATITQIITFITGTSLVTVFLYHLAYTFTLTDYEALLFSAEERYLGSILLAFTGFGLYLLREWSEDWSLPEQGKWLVALVAVVLIMTHWAGDYRAGAAHWENYENSDASVAKALRLVVRETDRIYYAPTGKTFASRVVYDYVMTPVSMVQGIMPYDPAATPDDYFRRFTSCDYLYVQEIDDSFLKNYSSIIPAPSSLTDYTLYRIVSDDDGQRIEPYWTYRDPEAY